MILVQLILCCSPRGNDAHDVDPHSSTLPRNDLRLIDVCVVLQEPILQDRLYFLHKVDHKGLDAATEFTTWTDPLMRCAQVQLALPPGHDKIHVVMDWMPRGAPIAIHEMRIFAHAPHNKDDPYAVARYEPAPFQDYVFFVNLMTPSLEDASTVYLPPSP